ncbi:MAG: hypothetical protein JXR64_05685 [Spirochaetales bacterium]|nr:hypothetical protein [Spirochaetales bacterium]
MKEENRITVDLTAVIYRIKDSEPQIMTIPSPLSLPSGAFDPENHRTMELGLRSWVQEQTGQKLDYVEQIYTYGNWHRNKSNRQGSRNVTVGYYALMPYVKTDMSLPGRWMNLYNFFPWEDFRSGIPGIVTDIIEPNLIKWSKDCDPLERKDREERIRLNFGDFRNWDMSKVLFRYEILYEAGLVSEAHRDWDDWAKDAKYRLPISSSFIDDMNYRNLSRDLGLPMAGDHRRILASMTARIRGKIPYKPIAFKLLPKEFTLLAVQHVYEGITGMQLHKQNFRRYIKQGNFVIETGDEDATGPGRPAAVYSFRSDVEAERVNVGLNLPFKRIE